MPPAPSYRVFSCKRADGQAKRGGNAALWEAKTESRRALRGGQPKDSEPPVIFVGVTTHTDNFTELTVAERMYVDVLQDIGVTPVLLTNTADFVEIEARLSKLDGLVLIGGGDVHPCHYGNYLEPNVKYMDLNRDRDLC